MNLNKCELMNINGGGISATLINALSRGINTILNLGQIVGTAIRRIQKRNYC